MHRVVTASLLAGISLVPQAYAKDQETTTDSSDIEVIQIKGSRLDKAATATGLPLTLRETPQSVSIIDQEFIQSFSLNNIAEIMTLSPGIYAQQAETNRYFFNARGNPITNFQFDGVPVNYSSFFNDAVTDTIIFDRVEIVRGATGLLTGAGEPSAAINLIRKRPKAYPSGYLSAKLGSWNSYRVEGDGSFDLDQDGKYQARIAAAYEDKESYVNLSEEQNLQLYAVFSAALSDQTKLLIGADHSKRDPRGSTWGGLPLFYADGSLADDLSTSSTTAASWSRWEREGTNVFASVEHSFDSDWDLRIDLEHREDEMDGHLLYLSGYPDKTTGLGMGALPMIYQSWRDQDAARLFVSGPFELFGRSHRLTAGLLYSKQEVDADSYYSSDTLQVGNFFEWDGSIKEPSYTQTPQRSESTETQQGAYLASQLSLHDDVTLILGARLSKYEMEVNQDNKDYKHDDVFTPYAGLVYKLNDTLSLYASYTEIFQPQNAKDVNNQYLDPVTGNNIELGAKGDFFNEALTASLAVFKVQKDNVAEADPGQPPLPDGSFPQRAVKGTNNKGFELELSGHPSDDLDVFFSYTYSESEKADGSHFGTHLPKHLLRISSLYHFDGALSDLTLGGNISWQSKTYKDQVGPNKASSRQDSYFLANLMASYQIQDNLVARLNVRNLFDKKYYSSIDFYNQGFFGEPRSLELSINYTW
ncbi:TonB-dependent siderophore receptor [Shewanella algae]|uniref:TonB-dependent siderophore receptor n=1 Tax=Shewanella algae TaxID=38313 RepID=UPI003AAE0246